MKSVLKTGQNRLKIGRKNIEKQRRIDLFFSCYELFLIFDILYSQVLDNDGKKVYIGQALPGGLNYEINDSESISAGQKQLLTIARGMIKDAPFLILDEATSSVDTRTEELVQEAMDKLTEGRTSFIIAHRLSTIKNADKILVMKEGNIVEQGTHEELLKKNGAYAELYNSQFQN